MTSRKRFFDSWKVRIALLVIGAVLVAYGTLIAVPIGWQQYNSAIMTLNGELIPFSVDMSKPFDVMLSAGVIFQYSGTDLANGFDLSTAPLFAVFNFASNQFQIQFTNNKMFVSANIKNSNNTLIAQIVNNTWKTVNPDTLLFWDRNYNAYAFEIIGSTGKPTLQVIMVGPNKIQIGGLFYTKTGSIYIAPEPDGAMLYVNVGDQHLEEEAAIQTIFKYPALTNSSNLGKMINPIYPSSDPLSEPIRTIIFGVALFIIGTILMGLFGVETYIVMKKEVKHITVVIESKRHDETPAEQERDETKKRRNKQKQYHELRRKDKEKRKRRRVAKE
jgi:hypothetical protein